MVAGGSAGLARHLVAAAHHSAAASPHRVPADPHPRRHREPREDAGADPLVAHADPHVGCRAGDPGAGRAGAQSQQREGALRLRPRRSGRRQRLGRRRAMGRAHIHDRAADRGSRRPEPTRPHRAHRQRGQGHQLEDRGAGRGPLDGSRRAAPALLARPHGDGAGDRRRAHRRRRCLDRLARRRHRPRRHRARLCRQARQPLRRQAVRGGDAPRPGGARRRRRRGGRRTPRRAGAAPRGRPARGHAACHVRTRPAPRRGAVHAWAPARRARLPPSTCRSSSGTR